LVEIETQIEASNRDPSKQPYKKKGKKSRKHASPLERLMMLHVDLLNRASLRPAFDGCDGVIHTVSLMHDNQCHR